MGWSAFSSRNEPPPIMRGGWLDALRFIVAGLIILHHFQASAPVPLAAAVHPVFERGGFLLTNFFLIDSGYVLMRVYGASVAGGRMSKTDFFLKRALRVYPAHLIMGGLLVAMVLLGTAIGLPPSHPEWFAWDQLPAQLALVQSFGVHGGLGWNAPSWSISALLGCYLVFPWVLRGLTQVGPWTALGLVIVGYLAANELCWAILKYPTYQMPLAFGIWRALPLFILGMGLAWFAQGVWINPRLAGWALLLASVALAIVQYFDKHALISLVFISIIILAAGAVPVKKPSKLIEQAAVVSFSMFISNEVVRIGWFGLAEATSNRLNLGEAWRWLLWVMGVGAAFVFAFLFHYGVDNPIQKRIRAWLKKRGHARATIKEPVISLEG
ncbi:peptidoglycan/LPS O-acetylase OafA/YrhL [Brevundimonas faecalis]|uniref:Peptidoglycan/LPS O-acetylase OafA/YrhL n=2 Tax=Brevundimonas faecalis TaxID=947378 RepID=A0ABV2RF61_9CAUL